jgi:glycogen debranching enzyme
VSDGWTYRGGPPALANDGGAVTLVDGSTFCISDRTGDVVPGSAMGLFVRDTRFVSTWLTKLDGSRLEELTVTGGDPFSATHVARRPPERGRADSALLVLLERRVGEGMCMALEVRNLSSSPVSSTLTITVDADFADLFEVKEGRTPSSGEVTRSVRDAGLWLELRSGHIRRALVLSGSGDPALDAGSLTWHLRLPGRAQWMASVEADVVIDGVRLIPSHRCGTPVGEAEPAARLRQWRASALALATPDAGLVRTLARSVEDLGSLRIFDPSHPARVVVAAGTPWFMALFGRDALLTSLMLLPVDRQLALGSMQSLAALQGTRVDAASEEEPGRIPHETRFGPAAVLSLGGGSVYYGSADATPLFVVLLGELHRFGAEQVQVHALLPHADRALEWVDRFGDKDGDGFVEYERATPRGLLNQGWKDSFDGISFADGTLAEAPIALCEVQAYVYAALLARAAIARSARDAETADRCAERAGRLKSAFNERFWLPELGWFAVGLDRNKRPIDALTSNVGHCLWSGIVDADKAASLAEHLLSPRMFTGWGVRTLASDMGAYNPVSYHNGSVWPHDSALVASGLMRYGFVDHAQRVAVGLLDAADNFGGRLPELFCGFDRSDFAAPVPYPTSCSPQAWAAAAPVHLLRTLLRLDPDVPAATVSMAPVLPWRYLPLTLDNVSLADARVRLSVDHDGFELTPLPAGLSLVPPPGPPAARSGRPGPT